MNMYEIIKELCNQKGITVAELERKANLGNGTIRRWGVAYPSLDKAMTVANILNVEIEYLYTGKIRNLPNASARKMEALGENEVKAVNDLIDFYLAKKK